MITFKPKYLLFTLILFMIETGIALYVRDSFIRPFGGDVLVVVLIYCFVRIFLNVNYRKTAIGVFIFACIIEILQYFKYVKLLGLQDNPVLSVMLGTSFAWLDFAAYFVGFLLIILSEKLYERYKTD